MFDQFLASCGVPTDSKARPNLLSLKGGRYFIKPTAVDKFFELYTDAIKECSEKTKFYHLVFVPPLAQLQPLLLDIDTRTADKYSFDSKTVYEYAKSISQRTNQQKFLGKKL